MTINATSGPNISFGITLSSSGATQEYNEERGPSLMDLGEGLMDPRPQFSFKPGSRPGFPVYGWAGLFGGPVIDQVPKTADSSGIAATQSATSGGSLTLQTSAASSAITSVSLVPSTGNTAVTVLAIDGGMAGKAFGSAGTINLWDPAKAITRALTISNSSNDSGINVTISGYDLYGFAMTQTLAGPNAGTVTTSKAFKYISTITLSAAGNSTSIRVGTADVFGFPLRVDNPAYLNAWWGPSSAASLAYTSTNGQHTFASTATATSSTGDVRGTLGTSSYQAGVSNSSATNPNRLVMMISPSVGNLATVTSNDFSGIVGVPQA